MFFLALCSEKEQLAHRKGRKALVQLLRIIAKIIHGVFVCACLCGVFLAWTGEGVGVALSIVWLA